VAVFVCENKIKLQKKLMKDDEGVVFIRSD